MVAVLLVLSPLLGEVGEFLLFDLPVHGGATAAVAVLFIVELLLLATLEVLLVELVLL